MNELGAKRVRLTLAAKVLLLAAVLGAVSMSLTATAQPVPHQCSGNELDWRVRSLPGEISVTLVIAEHAEPQWLTLCRGNEPGLSAGLQVEALYVLKEGGQLYRQTLDIDQCISVEAVSLEVTAIKQGDHIKEEAAASGHWCE